MIAIHRRRTAVTRVILAACAVTAALAFTVPLFTGHDRGSGTVTTAVAADYIGSSWRLTQVQQGGESIAIPADLGTGMSLFPDGTFCADDGVNAIGGQLTRTSDGFTVVNVSTTLVGYVGEDPHRSAAIQALRGITKDGGPVEASSSSATNTIVNVDQQQLVLDTGNLRLTFQRVGPAASTPSFTTTSDRLRPSAPTFTPSSSVRTGAG